MTFAKFSTAYLTYENSPVVRRVKVIDDDGGDTVLVQWSVKRRRAGTRGYLRADYSSGQTHAQRVSRDRLSDQPV